MHSYLICPVALRRYIGSTQLPFFPTTPPRPTQTRTYRPNSNTGKINIALHRYIGTVPVYGCTVLHTLPHKSRVVVPYTQPFFSQIQLLFYGRLQTYRHTRHIFGFLPHMEAAPQPHVAGAFRKMPPKPHERLVLTTDGCPPVAENE